MRVDFHKHFLKMLDKLPPGIVQKFYGRLELFEQYPYHRFLNNHSVDKAYSGWRSINITGDFRALYEPKDDGLVIFMKIGTHS